MINAKMGGTDRAVIWALALSLAAITLQFAIHRLTQPGAPWGPPVERPAVEGGEGK